MAIPSRSCGDESPVAMFPFWTGHFSRSVGMHCDVLQHIAFHHAPITNTSFTETCEMCAAYLLSTLEISYINTLFLHSLWYSVDYLKCNAGFLSVFHKDGSLFFFWILSSFPSSLLWLQLLFSRDILSHFHSELRRDHTISSAKKFTGINIPGQLRHLLLPLTFASPICIGQCSGLSGKKKENKINE